MSSSGPSSTGHVPTSSTAPAAAPPFVERPLPPTPTTEDDSSTVDDATTQPTDAMATPAAAPTTGHSLAPPPGQSRNRSVPMGTPVSTPEVAEAIRRRVPTPFPTARALPLPPDESSTDLSEEPSEQPSEEPSEQPPAPPLPPLPPSPPAVQPPRRVSIAVPRSSTQSSSQSSAQTSRSPRPAPVEYVVPRWQPDKEVLYCPICFVYFSLFNRKHHCRCSPHRIVIPHAYIVQPPDVVQAEQAAGASSSASAALVAPSSTDSPVLGGGERVRLCNPCVPDPNTSPPSAPGAAGHLRSRSGSSIAGGASYASYGSRRHGLDIAAGSGSSSSAGQASASNTGERRYTVSNAPSSGGGIVPGGRYQHYGSLPPTTHYHSHHHHYRPADGDGMMAEHASSSAQRRQQQQQQQQRYQIPEEDECPVCHFELPKRTLPSFETLREQHIEECIRLHSQILMGNTGNTGNGRTRATSTATASSATSAAQPTPARRISESNSNSESENENSLSSSSSENSLSSSGPGSAVYSPSSPRAMAVHRHTGIFSYKATAKDCAADAECTICLEDLEVGDAMARLECFCRFHEHCIRAWFVRHPGRCPVHQHGMAD